MAETPSASGAVFLSYASQDAEAAKRICEALRAAGVEVWFDQSELVGGDQWDGKIRGQISSCALFVPIISAATQARLEGYFRLEWKLAAQRTHTMADEKTFLLPVLIDGTRDAEARVPAEFKSVQWTKLPGGETPPAFVARVQKLLGGEAVEAGRPRPADRGEGTPAPRKKSRLWLVPVILAAVLAGLWQQRRNHEPAPVTEPKAAAVPAVTPQLTEAQKLVAQARQIYDNGDELNRENLFLAEELVQRALKLDPAEPAAWELSAWLSYLMVWHLIDESPARRETLLRQASRALALAPESVSAQLVHANAQLAGRFMVRAAGQSHLEETEQSLRRLAEREPQDWRVPRALGTVYRLMNRTDDAIRALTHALELSGDNPMAVADLVNVYIRRQRLPEAEALLARTLPHRRSGRLLTFDVVVKCRWRSDTAGALRAIETWPAWLLQEDRGMALAWQAGYWGHQPEAALRIVQQFPREEVRDLNFSGPRAVLSARAHEMAGDTAAAQADWRTVMQRCDQALVADSQDVIALHWKAWALARLGDQAGAQAAATLLRQHMRSVASSFFNVNTAAPLWATVGWTDLALSDLRALLETPVDGYSLTRAYLEMEPAFDPLRQDPHFKELVAAAPAPPTPLAASSSLSLPGLRSLGEAGSPSTLSVADSKSVAVLAFANLSDDKGNEYFSDGISEELLNVLAKVPGLKVSARTSAFYFKGKEVPIPEIAQKLGVAYVVEGSVRKQGDKVRITAQLIKAADGFQVWSDTFTRELKDVFAVQDEIAGLIAQNLSLKVGVTTTAAVNPEAYRLRLEARYFVQRENNEGWKKAIELYRQNIALEPSEAASWAEMAKAYTLLGRYGGMTFAESFREARTAAERALVLDPELAQAHSALGWVQRTADWDWKGAEKSFRRALTLAPRSAEVIRDNAVLAVNLGRIEEAIALIRQAVELDPLNATGHNFMAIILAADGRLPEAERAMGRAIELAPAAVGYRAILSAFLSEQKHWPEAAAAAGLEPSESYQLFARACVQYARGERAAGAATQSELIAKYADAMGFYVAAIYVRAGDPDRAFEWLDRAFDRRDSALAWCKTSWAWHPLHPDPRWPVFLKKLGLTDEQLK